jgi:hypothetical protein
MSSHRIVSSTALVIAGCVVLSGCPLGSPTGVVIGTPHDVLVVQGNNQSVQAGRALAAPVVLRVVDAQGRGLVKQVVSLVVTAGGGAADPVTSTTDSTGETRVKWTLGTEGRVQALVATVSTVGSVIISANATFPVQILVAQGDGQSAKIVTALKNDVVVRVTGVGNIPMIGIPVTFSVKAGGGGLSPQSGVTNALGELSTKWTMGASAGSNAIVASSGDLPSVTVNATATP